MGFTYIKSKNNQSLKFIQQIIKSRKKRILAKVYWLEGEKNVRTFLSFENKKFISKIVTTEKFCSVLREDFQLDLSRFDVIILDDKLFKEFSLINTKFRVGLLVTFERTKQPLISNDHTDILYLSDIQDPGNLGTIIRSCAAMNVREIWLSPNSVDPWSPKVIRSSAGYHSMVRLIVFDSFSTVMEASSKLMLTNFLLSPEKGGISLFQQDLTRRNLFIFGSEGKGFPKYLKDNANLNNVLVIPQIGTVDSLNLSVAASLCIVESRRQKGLLSTST